MQLGAELERLRKQAGFTSQKEAVKGLAISDSQLSRVEKGTSAFRRTADLVALLKRYGITDKDDVQFLVDIHKDSLNRGWWSVYSRTMPSGMAMYVGLEDGARTIRAWHPSIVFGLLQTKSYAEAISASVKAVDEFTTEQVKRNTEVRMQRKEILTRHSPVEIRVIMSDAALRNTMGGRDVMLEQYEELLRLAKLDNVAIQILPLSAPGYYCSYDFTLLEFGDSLPTVVQMDEIDGGSRISDKDTEIWSFSRRFDALRDGALPVGETPNFLKQLTREI